VWIAISTPSSREAVVSHGAGVGLILGLIILILVPFIPFAESVPRSLVDITDVQEKVNLGLSAA
jgi:hypothetical protein